MTGATYCNSDFSITYADPVETQASGPWKSQMELNMDEQLGAFRINTLHSKFFSLHQLTANLNHSIGLKSPVPERQYGLALITSGADSIVFGNEIEMESQGGDGHFISNDSMEEDHCFSAEKPVIIDYLELNVEYINRLLTEVANEHNSLSKLTESFVHGTFVNLPVTITPLHTRIVADMKNCALKGTLGNLLLEGYLQQLIAIQLASLTSKGTVPQKVNNRDKETFHAVRDHLQTSLREDHSLESLSRKFGINQTKLKSGFKTTFGISVFQCLYNLKMEHARSLIFDKGMFVNEAASQVGYKNPNHFATAFKRKFGISPSLLKG